MTRMNAISSVCSDSRRLARLTNTACINVTYLARLCGGDWGLYHDVLASIVRVREVLARRADLDVHLAERAQSALDSLEAAIESEPKSTKWKRRARVGTRRQWHDDVEDQDVRTTVRPCHASRLLDCRDRDRSGLCRGRLSSTTPASATCGAAERT